MPAYDDPRNRRRVAVTPRPDAPPPAPTNAPYSGSSRGVANETFAAAPAPAPEPLYAEPAPAPSDGGGGGGSYGAAPANPAQYAAYLTLLRELGDQEAEVQADAQRQVADLQRGLANRLPEIDRAYDEGKRRIGTNFEQRGLLRSGAYERGVTEAGAERTRQALQATEAATLGQNQVQAEAARRLSEVNRRRAELALQYES